MRKCNICGKRFKLRKNNRYEVAKIPIGFNSLIEAPTYYNAFDCPHCGCQNIVGEFEKGPEQIGAMFNDPYGLEESKEV